jgi:hypothetical protein
MCVVHATTKKNTLGIVAAEQSYSSILTTKSKAEGSYKALVNF